MEGGWKMVEDGWKMGGRWVEDEWKIGGRWVEDWWKLWWLPVGWKMRRSWE
jgi:hypothetical protein